MYTWSLVGSPICYLWWLSLLQGRTFKTITLPVHNIILRSSGGICWYGGIFYPRFHINRKEFKWNIWNIEILIVVYFHYWAINSLAVVATNKNTSLFAQAVASGCYHFLTITNGLQVISLELNVWKMCQAIRCSPNYFNIRQIKWYVDKTNFFLNNFLFYQQFIPFQLF